MCQAQCALNRVIPRKVHVRPVMTQPIHFYWSVFINLPQSPTKAYYLLLQVSTHPQLPKGWHICKTHPSITTQTIRSVNTLNLVCRAVNLSEIGGRMHRIIVFSKFTSYCGEISFQITYGKGFNSNIYKDDYLCTIVLNCVKMNRRGFNRNMRKLPVFTIIFCSNVHQLWKSIDQ